MRCLIVSVVKETTICFFREILVNSVIEGRKNDLHIHVNINSPNIKVGAQTLLVATLGT